MSVRRPTVLTVVNFPLPPNDYRVDYARRRAGVVRTIFVGPAAPSGVPEDDIVLVPFGEGVTWRDLGSFVRLAVLLLRQWHTIGLAHYYSTKLILLGPVLSALAGVPSVVTVTGFGRAFSEQGARYALARVVHRAAFRLATRLTRFVLFQNRGDLEATVARLPALASKGRYVGSATGTVHPQRVQREGRLKVLHVARLLPSKGIADFLAVARSMRDAPADFVLAGGPSPDYPELAAAVEAADGDGVLHYVGRVDKGLLDEIYAGSDVFFFPSYSEGMARVMLEAGMWGLCPVAYCIPANHDLVAPGRGFLVPVGDVEAAQAVLVQLAHDRAMLAENADRYKEHVRRHFTMEAFAERIDAVIAEATGRAFPA